MQKILKPARPDLKVHVPATKLFLKAEGQPIVLTTYWRRRLACGDVVEVTEAKTAKKVTKKVNKKDEPQNEPSKKNTEVE